MSEVPPRRRFRLLWTLLAVVISVSVLPLVVSHVSLIEINRDSLEILEKKYLTRSAVGIANETQGLVRSYLRQLEKIAGGLQLGTSMVPGSDPFVAASESGVISSYLQQDPNLFAMRLVNQSGQGAMAQPAGLESEIVRDMDSGISAALNGKQYIGAFQYIKDVNQPAIVLAVPVTNAGTIVGAVEVLLSLKTISDRLRDEAKGDVSAFIVDRSGRALMHSEPSIAVERPDYSDLKIVQEFMKAPVRLTETYMGETNGRRARVLGTVAPVAAPDWGVVVQKEEAKAFASVTKMIRRTTEWSAIAMILAIGLGTLFAHRISRPIRALAVKTREIAAGNYQNRVEINNRNEIGELAENFNLMSGEIEKSVEQLKKAANENHLLFINSIRMLAAAIDAKDPYTRGHSERVARYSIAIGKHLRLDTDEMRNLRISALLHDVGKIGIDDRILRKPGALSDEEFEVMKGHPDKGAAIMSGVAQLIDIIPGMKYHHEKWAGGGYPDGLKGEEIPMQARIVSIADTFDAMTTNRPYQKAMDLTYVVEKISSFANTRFDPRVVQAFVSAVKSGDIQIDDQVRGAA